MSRNSPHSLQPQKKGQAARLEWAVEKPIGVSVEPGVGAVRLAIVLQALEILSWDDETGEYRMQADNDGRWLETEVRLIEGEKGTTGDFRLGVQDKFSPRNHEHGEWTEATN